MLLIINMQEIIVVYRIVYTNSNSEDDDDGKDFITDPKVKECVFELGYYYRCEPN